MQLETLAHHPITPAFRTPAPDARIDFGEFDIVVREGGSNVVPQRAKLFLDLKRPKSLRLESIRKPLTDKERILRSKTSNGQSPVNIEFLASGTTAEWMVQSSSWSDTIVYSPYREPLQLHQQTDKLRHATFQLFNWPCFRGETDFVLENQSFGRVCGRVFLSSGGWKICIAEIPEAEALLNDVGKCGYAMTHCGKIEREDANAFSSTDLEDLLEMLQQFFSFVMGRNMAPTLTAGFDPGGEKLFQHCGLGAVSAGAWSPVWSFFDPRHSNILSQVFPGFHRRWQEPHWRHAFRGAIYWYIGANSAGKGTGVNVDGALMFSQAALELLAWTYCVLDRKLVSKTAFGKTGLSAAEKIRLLATNLNIPLAIPPHFKDLYAFANNSNPTTPDLAHAITSLRNRLVHPDNKRSGTGGNRYGDAWRISMWLIEMILLRICDFNGSISDRSLELRTAGEVTPVPWV